MNNKRSLTSRSQNTRKSYQTAARKGSSETALRVISSPAGLLLLTANGSGLTRLLFVKRKQTALKGPANAEKILDATVKALIRYFRGDISALKGIPLAFEGTAFQKSVWKALINIPAGKTASYQYIAQTIKRPKAVRAVGTACGRNHLCLIVPCHRVVAANNGLGGFSGGLEIKKKLLRHEGSLNSLR